MRCFYSNRRTNEGLFNAMFDRICVALTILNMLVEPHTSKFVTIITDFTGLTNMGESMVLCMTVLLYISIVFRRSVE